MSPVSLSPRPALVIMPDESTELEQVLARDVWATMRRHGTPMWHPQPEEGTDGMDHSRNPDGAEDRLGDEPGPDDDESELAMDDVMPVFTARVARDDL